MAFQHFFYVPGSTTVIDAAIYTKGEWRGFWGQHTLAEIAARHPAVQLLDGPALDAAISDALAKRFDVAPVEITRDRFHDMLDILPPQRWTRSGGRECFHMLEATSHDYHFWFIRLGSRYFELVKPRSMDPARVCAIAEDWAAANPPAPAETAS